MRAKHKGVWGWLRQEQRTGGPGNYTYYVWVFYADNPSPSGGDPRYEPQSSKGIVLSSDEVRQAVEAAGKN